MPDVNYSANKKEYMRQYRLENRARIKARQKAWNLANAERERERCRKWKRENRERVNASNRKNYPKWYRQNREKWLERARNQAKKEGRAYFLRKNKEFAERVTPGYARKLLCGDSMLRAKDIPQALVALKQVEIKLRRKVHGKA